MEDIMKIVHVMHGDPELWALLGESFCSRATHKELGGPIYSSPGMHWWVAVERHRMIGFVSLRPTSSALWFDYAYVVETRRGDGIFVRLAQLREVEIQAKHPGFPLRLAVRTQRWPHYQKRGWKQTSRRGSWVYGQREPSR